MRNRPIRGFSGVRSTLTVVDRTQVMSRFSTPPRSSESPNKSVRTIGACQTPFNSGYHQFDSQSRVSGPFLARIDLTIEITAVGGSADVRAGVLQSERFAARLEVTDRTGGNRSGELLDETASANAGGFAFLKQAANTLSACGFHRTLHVARTLADLEASPNAAQQRIAEVLSYRGEVLRMSPAHSA